MGQKTNANEFRLGINEVDTPNVAVWFANTGRDYSSNLHTDIIVRDFILEKTKQAMVSEINIERSSSDSLLVIIHCAKPGVITGKGGAAIQALLAQLTNLVYKKTQKRVNIKISVKEVSRYEHHASLIAHSIATSIEKRVMPKKAMKREIDRVMRAQGVSGIKIIVSGRIGGADIARSEKQQAGRVPLHTLKANIKYHNTTAKTTYGIMGIKVWLFVEETHDSKKNKEMKDAAAS
jgi:small subunit ribosomal protein S3